MLKCKFLFLFLSIAMPLSAQQISVEDFLRDPGPMVLESNYQDFLFAKELLRKGGYSFPEKPGNPFLSPCGKLVARPGISGMPDFGLSTLLSTPPGAACDIFNDPSFHYVSVEKNTSGPPALAAPRLECTDTDTGKLVACPDSPQFQLKFEAFPDGRAGSDEGSHIPDKPKVNDALIRKVLATHGSATGQIVVTGDGISVSIMAGTAVFRPLRTIDDRRDGIIPECRYENPEDDPIRLLRDKPARGICGGILVRDGSGKPVFLTADHCTHHMERQSLRTFVVFDFVDGHPGLDLENRTFSSSDFIEITGMQVERRPDLDLATIAVPEDSGTRQPVLPARWIPNPSDLLLALTFPLGVTLTPVGADDTSVIAARGYEAFADIDNFASSSGGPVFDRLGRLVGILSSQSVKSDWHSKRLRGGGSCHEVSVIPTPGKREAMDIGVRIASIAAWPELEFGP